MSDDPLSKARHALTRVAPASPAASLPTVDTTRLNTLLARARGEASSASTAKPQIASPPPPPNKPRVFLDMTCSATGRSYVAVAERDDNRLRLIGSRSGKSANGDTDAVEGLLSGQYVEVIAAKDWVCPECRAHHSECAFWFCDCPSRRGAAHCGSRGNRPSYCACGLYERRRLVSVESVSVRGEAAAPTARAPQATPGATPGLPSLPRYGKGF